MAAQYPPAAGIVVTGPLTIVGSSPDTERVACGLGLPVGLGAPDERLIVLARSAQDIGAIRAALEAGMSIVCVIAMSLAEEHVVAAYDLGLPVAFGFCALDEVDAAIAGAPDAAARELAVALASIEHAIGER